MKQLLTCLLALTMVLTLTFALAACGEEPDPTPTPDDGGTVTPPDDGGDQPEQPTRANYVITVVDQNGDAVVGAAVSICTVPTDGGEGTCSLPVATDANGVSTHANKKIDSYAAQVVIPDGYSHADQYEDASGSIIIKVPFAEGATTITIELTKN